MALRIDPWGSTTIKEYERLFTYFGIKPFKEVLPELSEVAEPHPLMRRGVVFGHRDFNNFLKAIKSGGKTAILTGLMPSGRMHLGHKMVIDQLVYYQKAMNADIFIAIADVEAYSVRKKGRRDVIETALNEYIPNYLALGLDPEKTVIYFQSSYRLEYYRLIQLFSRKVTLAEMQAIYGQDLGPAKIMAALTQAADILHPYLDEFGGYDVVLVPVGADQDPHLRLARDIADRYSSDLGLGRPASTYHRLMNGLTGGKMSSSKPESYIALTDPPEEAANKVMKSLTGGRATAEEQRRLGGEPQKCPVFELNAYHLIPNDKELRKLYDECISGTILCGRCKRETAERLKEFLREHQERLNVVKELVKEVVKPPKF